MRPVDAQFETSQDFGSFATAGVVGNSRGTTVQQLVALYGNYQEFGHAGTDIACPIGTPVRAMAAGTVLYAGWGEDLPGDESDAGYRRRWYLYKNFPGIITLIQHWWGIGEYGHLSSNDAAPAGTVVTEGQVIGYSGNTKTRTTSVGAHLHVGAIVDSNYRNGNGLIYGRTDPTQFFGSGLAPQGTITPTSEEDELSKAAEEDIARIRQILEAVESDAIRARIIAIDNRTAAASSKYLKSEDPNEPTLYELVGGKLRGINLAEWQASGAGYRELPQDVINALPRA